MTELDTHRAPDGLFRNPWPDSAPPSWGEVLRFMRDRSSQTLAKDPPRGSFPVATPAISYPRAGLTDFKATWIGHSTVLLQFGGLNLITDPVFSQRAFPVQWAGPRRIMDPALPLDALPPIDVVLISHSHYDHLDKPAVKAIAGAHPAATWIVPLGLGAYIRGWGARDIVELDWWQQATVQGLRVTATPAQHFSARRIGDRNRSLWCGFVMEIEGRRAWFAGDTAYHPQFGEIGARCGPFDFVMIPIGAYDPRWFMHTVHMDPDEAMVAYRALTSNQPEKPPCMTLHWGTFRLTDEAVEEPPARFAELWRNAGFPDEANWTFAHGETRKL